MKNLRSLFDLNVSNVTFREARLVNGNPEGPKGPSQSAEVPKQQMMPLAKDLIKDIMEGKNGISASKFSRVKSSPTKQQALIENWLKTAKLQKKRKPNLFGTADITSYYLGSKKVNPKKVAREVYAFIKIRKNRNAILAAIKKERAGAKRATSAVKETSQESSAGFQEKGFTSRRAATITTKFFVSELTKLRNIVNKKTTLSGRTNAEDSRQLSALTSAFQKKVNKYLNPLGVNVGTVHTDFSSDDVTFNGPVAYKNYRKRKNQIRRGLRKLG